MERESRATLPGLADTSLIVGLLELGCAVGWVPGYRPGSGCHLLNDNDVPLFEFPPWVGFLLKRTVRLGD